MAVPMYLLYEGGSLFARLMARSKAKRQEPQGDDTLAALPGLHRSPPRRAPN
jgi:hypothetical protein